MISRRYISKRSQRRRARNTIGQNSTVLETNHRLVGMYLSPCILQFNGKKIGPVALGDGNLIAPDHATRKLAGKAHALVRTPNLTPRSEVEIQMGWE